MRRDQYRRLRESPARDLFQSVVVNDGRLMPTRSRLGAQLDEALPNLDAPTRRKVWRRLVDLAERAADGENVFHLRQAADNEAVAVLEEIDAADELVTWPDEDGLDDQMAGGIASKVLHGSELR